MLRKIAISAVSALCLMTGAAQAAGGEGHIHDTAFAHEGPFGTFDKNQLQRGLQVYTEVCSACHGMKFVPVRTLADEGGPELPADQVRAYIPRRYITLGTDGFGRSDYRVQLRRFFEVNRYYVAVAALKALADEGQIKAEQVEAAIRKYGLDTERPDPWTV